MVLRSRHDGAVLIVELNRPRARNALNSELLDRLNAEVKAAQTDDDIGAVVLTGAGSAFCAGLDLEELRSTGRNRRLEDTGSGPLPALRKPLVGAINGPAVTGGLELALRCHILIGSREASFIDTHARRGLTPRWGITGLLPQAVGVRVAREMSLTGRTMDADEALSRGLLHRIVPAPSLVSEAIEVARDLTSLDTEVVGHLLALYDAFERAVAEPALQHEVRVTLERFAQRQREQSP